MKVDLPDLSLVLLIGPSGSGKSTFAQRHFLPTEVVSSDTCRGLVADNENCLTVNEEAFALVHEIVRLRLKLGRLTVVDATNVNPADRRALVAIAREFHVLPTALVFKLPAAVCHARNQERPDRDFSPHVIQRQLALLRKGLRGLKREGFRRIHIFDSETEVEAVEGIERQPMWNDRREESGPFDIVGDVHGCAPELHELLHTLGYAIDPDTLLATHPDGRRLVFVGDLADRGPDSPGVLRLAMNNVRAGLAHCVPGNHDVKLLKHLRGKQVGLTHGLDLTVEQLDASDLDRAELTEFLGGLVSHYVFDGGRLVVAHAGIREEMQGRGSAAVREFCLYGETTGERDEWGLPERLDWAADYRGEALVVYGHTPFHEPRWLNNTVNIDTGCVFGGSLTALRYPERETVSVPARETYVESPKPLLPDDAEASAQQAHDQVLDLADFRGRRMLHTRLRPKLSVQPENLAAAIELVSRFGVDPRWLVYLPPTMSPCATSEREGWLERPEEAFAYYANRGRSEVVCEEKHMGSRAVVIVCRRPEIAQTRFGMDTPSEGVVLTRTGRPFFRDDERTAALLRRTRDAVQASGLWEELETDWLCLDCELMPWSVKAQSLLSEQYAAVASSGAAWHRAAGDAVTAALARDDLEGNEALLELDARLRSGTDDIEAYRRAYGRYCWPVDGVEDLRLAPFHILAGECGCYVDRDHRWHMEAADRLAATGDPVLQATRWWTVRLDDEAELAEAVRRWEELTASGGEGMVVKPLDFVARDERGRLLQPAVKCRGREYLRIIYGPTYTEARHLERLRRRGLGRKRSLAEREFCLGLEALEQFAARKPLRDVHACILALLSLESEPVDPRL